jgi:hypothetical protein
VEQQRDAPRASSQRGGAPQACPPIPPHPAPAARAAPQLRHPNVLSYKDSLEVPERGGVTLYLVTEPVKPLSAVMADVDLGGQHK